MAKHDRYLNNVLIIEQACSFLAIVLIILLLVSQTALVYLPITGPYMNTALRLEGQSLYESEPVNLAGEIKAEPWAVINLKLQDYVSRADVVVFVDGEELGDFRGGEVTVPVKQGARISVINPDSRLPVTIVINRITPNILEPSSGGSVQGSGELHFGPVLLKP